MRLGTDKQLVKKRFEANLVRYNRLALVQQDISTRLAELAGSICRGEYRRIYEVGAGTGFLTCRLADIYPSAEFIVNDIVPSSERFVAKYIGDRKHEYLWGDAENMDFPIGLDIVASASTVQWFDDLPNFIRKSYEATVRGGWLILSTFGPQNFREIKETTGEGLDYYGFQELKELISDVGYRVVKAEEYERSLFFDTPVDVLHHIKATGVNSLKKEPWNRRRLAEFTDSYIRKFSSRDGKVTLTYHPIIIIAQKEKQDKFFG